MRKHQQRNIYTKTYKSKWDLTTGTAEIQRIIIDYYEQLYASKMDDQEKNGKTPKCTLSKQ